MNYKKTGKKYIKDEHLSPQKIHTQMVLSVLKPLHLYLKQAKELTPTQFYTPGTDTKAGSGGYSVFPHLCDSGSPFTDLGSLLL